MWRSSPSEKEQRQKQQHMVYTCGLFHHQREKGFVTSTGTLPKKTTLRTGALTTLWKSPKHIVTNSVTHHVGNSKGEEKVSTSHLQVGELLLLMGDGLLHQDTLNALFHCILLCLGSKKKRYELLMVEQHELEHISFFFCPELTYPLQCFLLLWGERRKAKLGARALSILHRQSFTSLEFTKHQFNPTVKSKSENGAWGVKVPAWIICKSK